MDKYPDHYHHSHPRTHHHGGSGGNGKTNLASCAVATAFIVLILIVLSVVFFILFCPRDPTIQVSAVQLPGFSARNGTVAFTFAQYASVRNPNRASFSHYDSTIRLIYRGSQVGFMFIPAGEIGGGRTQYMEASFAVAQFPLNSMATMEEGGGGGNIEVESRMKLKGRVRVLRFFMHRAEATAGCRIGVSAANGKVIGARC